MEGKGRSHDPLRITGASLSAVGPSPSEGLGPTRSTNSRLPFRVLYGRRQLLRVPDAASDATLLIASTLAVFDIKVPS
jgi:hypothetical protein